MGRGELFRRMGLAGAFALLLVACVAAPVLAQPVLTSLEEDPVAHEEALESPQAVAEREDSEYAFTNLTPAQEENLLREHFAAQLQAIDADPARLLADVALERIDSPTEALVTVEGRKALLESEVPLRAPEDDGDLGKVELELEETANGFEPANPLVDLTLPDAADEPIQIGDEGLTVTPVGASDVAASPLGEEDLFLPAAHEDTSLLLSPIAGGLELSALLTSRNSPEQLSFKVTLPQGAVLRAEETGGAAVVRDGEILATISAPRALDAQEAEVPVSLAVAGDTLTLSLAHREMDVAYPLFVDPSIVEENWAGFADPSKLYYWNWQWSGVGSEDFIGWRSCIVSSFCPGNGLYLRARANFSYPAGSWGRWWLTPQGQTTFISRAVLGPINFAANGCSANEPHGYVGVWNDYSGWKVLANAYPSGWGNYVDTGTGQNLGPGSRTVFVGLHAGTAAKLTCGRDYRLGGATLVLEDPEHPTVGTISGYPSGWIKDGAKFTVNAPVSDAGLGVKKAAFHPKGAVILKSSLACDGHRSNPCPANHTFQFVVGADSFDEGEKIVQVSAEDAIEKSTTKELVMKVDRTPPEVDLAGQLAQATGETGTDLEDGKDRALTLPVYNLQINATDGKSPSEGAIAPADKRSGVKSIEVFLDQKATPEETWTASSCTSGNCPLSKTFALKLNELGALTEHVLRVVVRDFAGNAPREREIEFEYIPATGMKDEYVMQYFPLDDGSGDEDEEEHPRRPELAVNLVNGNLVYRQKDVEVETASADLEVELFYNSLLPESENTEWGDGWTMGEEPSLEVEEPKAGSPEATIVEESGGIESRIDLPAAVGGESFDKRTQATITKEPGGGFEVRDETGETGDSLVFAPSGRLEEVENGTSATVDYSYQAGALEEIAIEDPGTASVAPESLQPDDAPPGVEVSHSANFGTPGSAAGQLKGPTDVVLDAQGNLFVLDRDNHRVQKFGPAGHLLLQFGSYGSADGQLNTPRGIAIDAAGNIWVADTGNSRVQKFSPTGQFLSKFGSFGWSAGMLLGPTGIAVGADGSIWVSDLRLQRFTAAGQLIGAVGAEELSSPEGLDIDSEGNAFVADSQLDKVLVFDEQGDYLRSFGSSGTGPGQLQNPTEVDVDSDGYAWVADAEADRVELYTAAGQPITRFGSPGSGAQQLALEGASGVASDGKGRLWVADAGNNRMAKWLASPITDFIHSANFGTAGGEVGQLEGAADVLLDADGNLLVLDRGNHRVQKFAPGGELLLQFGGNGSADGKLSNPAGIALDAAGSIWVADTGNSRIQQFAPDGQFLSKFGSFGWSAGKIFNPTGIAVGADGSVWVAESSRVQRFTAAGQLIGQVGGEELFSPAGIDIDAEGNAFVADEGWDKVAVFDEDGGYLRSFGSSGSGPGQLQNPTEVDVDSDGSVWVAEADGDRVQLFTSAGDYISGFGSPGSGAEQFLFDQWTGIAADGNGRLWVADGGNDRVSEWVGGHHEPSAEAVPTEDDPKIEVDLTAGGMVESVEGEEAGVVSYGHEGDLLTSVDGPESEADFTYDSAGRMTKVTLVNGTYAEIAYAATYGRVKSVTVAPKGTNPKTTYFSYSDEPRRTVVTPPDSPAATYDFAADGSVFKWWNSAQPPTFDDISGSLYENRETASPIAVGLHNLNMQAYSDHGIASIQIVANNNQLVDEKTCEFNPEEENSCRTVKNEWVTETLNWPPGIVHLEAITTDRLGNSTSERFWVNIPYTPPPDPEAEEEPRFGDILRFREEFGLDLDLKGDEFAINDRIFDLIGAWHNPTTPEGEVARATDAKWGVPLRAVDAAELEYREWYLAHNAPLISEWGQTQAPSSYAGFYIDHPAGGLIRIGFTNNQNASVEALKKQPDFVATDRFTAFSAQPNWTLSHLQALSRDFDSRVQSRPDILATMSEARLDIAENRLKLGGDNLPLLSSFVQGEYGSTSAISTFFQEPLGMQREKLCKKREEEDRMPRGRLTSDENLYAGDWMRSDDYCVCTLAFGAWSAIKGSQGQWVKNNYALSAGHCDFIGDPMYRAGWRINEEGKKVEAATKIGAVARNSEEVAQEGFETDAEAIDLAGGVQVPRRIFRGANKGRPIINGAGNWTPGMTLCLSGASSGARCAATKPELRKEYFNELGIWLIVVKAYSECGDSGSPIWDPRTGEAVGLLTGGGTGCFGGPTWVTPILSLEGKSYAPEVAPGTAPGALNAPSMNSPKPLNIVDGVK